MQELPETTHIAAMGYVIAYAGLQNRDAAFRWLEKAYENRDEDLTMLKVDPKLEPLRSEPRYHALVRRLKL
ncbi:MAG: hypothetical protein ABIS67_10545 [Candidatus Eisenbacteria bacterium]